MSDIILKDIDNVIYEVTLNYIAKENIAAFDINKFINKENNILFITGYTSAGKTTISDQIKKLFQYNILNLDEIIDYGSQDTINLKERVEFKLNIFYYKLLNRIEKAINNNQQLIVEGIQLFEFFEVLDVFPGIDKLYREKLYKYFMNNSIIIMNTGMIKTIVRDRKRQVKAEEMDLIDKEEAYYINLIMDKLSQRNDLKKYIKIVMDNYNKSQIKYFKNKRELFNYIERRLDDRS